MYWEAAPPWGSAFCCCVGFSPTHPTPLFFAAIFITVSLFCLFPCLQWGIMVWIYGLPGTTFFG